MSCAEPTRSSRPRRLSSWRSVRPPLAATIRIVDDQRARWGVKPISRTLTIALVELRGQGPAGLAASPRGRGAEGRHRSRPPRALRCLRYAQAAAPNRDRRSRPGRSLMCALELVGATRTKRIRTTRPGVVEQPRPISTSAASRRSRLTGCGGRPDICLTRGASAMPPSSSTAFPAPSSAGG